MPKRSPSDIYIRKPYNVVIHGVDADIYETFKGIVGRNNIGDAAREVFEIAMIRYIREKKNGIDKKSRSRS